MNIWTMTAAVISTSHVEQSTMAQIEEDGNHVFGIPGGFITYGAIFQVPEDNSEDEDFPDDLRAILVWARGAGFDWIRLDSDGDVIDGLPVYAW